MTESASIKAIELTRKVFEHVHGNLGLLKFAIDELMPTNGTSTEQSKKWRIICSFYETLGSSSPSKYKVDVNLDENTVRFEKIFGTSINKEKDKGSYVVKKVKKE